MTDNEIIKALECCHMKGKTCDDCPTNDFECFRLEEMALDLINRQKAEIERWRTECGNQSTLWSKHYESIFETTKETIKAEAIKEFADRLISKVVNTPFGVNCSGETDEYKEGCLHGLVAKQNNILDKINNLVKEMVGDS